MVERLERLSDLELWRDMRASKIEGAHCCKRARVSQPNASGLRLERRIFCGRYSRYTSVPDYKQKEMIEKRFGL